MVLESGEGREGGCTACARRGPVDGRGCVTGADATGSLFFGVEVFLGEDAVVGGAGGGGGVLEDGVAEGGGFGEFDVSADFGAEDDGVGDGVGGALGLGEEVFDFFGNFAGEFGGGFVLAEEDAGDVELGVEGLADHGDGVEEFFHALQGEELGLEGDDDFGGVGQGVEGEQTEGGGAVDEDEVGVDFLGFGHFAEEGFAGDDGDEFDFGGGEFGVGGGDEEFAVVGFDLFEGLGEGDAVGEDAVGGDGDGVGVDAHVGGEVGLGVEVDEDDFFAGVGESGAEVGGGGGFADAAFLVEEGDDAHGEGFR